MKLDELRPIAPGTLEKLCDVLGLNPDTVITFTADHEGVTVVLLIDGRVQAHRLVER